MPSPWTMVDSSFPSFTGEESPREQVVALVDYMYMLTEALKYQLENLDSGNWNTAALKDFQVDTTQDVAAQVAAVAATLTVVVNEVTTLSSRVSAVESLTGRVTQVETDVGYLQQGQEELLRSDREQNEQLEALQIGTDELGTEMTAVKTEVNKLNGTVQTDTDGNTTLGQDGKMLRLLGSVYINGVLIEQGGGV